MLLILHFLLAADFINRQQFTLPFHSHLRKVSKLQKVLLGSSSKIKEADHIDERLPPSSNHKILIYRTMDYLRMDGKQYASKVRNKALEDFDWLSQWLE